MKEIKFSSTLAAKFWICLIFTDRSISKLIYFLVTEFLIRCVFSCFSDHEVIPGLNISFIVGNNSDYLSNLTHWLRPVWNGTGDWKLCWRASQDGWSANTFHSLCDNKGPTITIIRVGKYIFGGYSSLRWPSKYHSWKITRECNISYIS